MFHTYSDPSQLFTQDVYHTTNPNELFVHDVHHTTDLSQLFIQEDLEVGAGVAVAAAGSCAAPAALLVADDATLVLLVAEGVLGADVRAVAVQTAVVPALLAVHEARPAAGLAEVVTGHAQLYTRRDTNQLAELGYKLQMSLYTSRKVIRVCRS